MIFLIKEKAFILNGIVFSVKIIAERKNGGNLKWL